MTDVCVDVIGEVDRRRPGGQVDDIAARGEDVDPVTEDVTAHRLDELGRIVHVGTPFHHLAQ